jgi:type II secretion system protein J
MRNNVSDFWFLVSGFSLSAAVAAKLRLGRSLALPPCRALPLCRALPARKETADTRNQKPQTVSGYLLLEVLLALAVLSVVVVMVFQIIQTTLRVTSDINFLETQQQKVDGICELLRRNFVSLPQTCLFQTRKHNESTELLFRYAPFNFSWLKSGAQFGNVVIASRPQPDGRFALSVLQESGNALESYVDAGTDRKGDWVPLINNIDQLSWRFYDTLAAKWLPDWPDTGRKPNLVEMTFKLAGRNHTERCVFRWPIAQTGS